MISTNNFDLLVKIGGRELGKIPSDTFFSFSMFENACKGPPSAEMQFSSTENLDLRDGIDVDVSLTIKTRNGELRYNVPFRLFSYKTSSFSFGNVVLYYLSCIYRSDILLSPLNMAVRGTSGDVFKYFSRQDPLLKAEVDRSSDFQVWMCINERGFNFLQRVCRCAWYDNSSCFVSAITKTGKLRLFNLSSRLSKQPTVSLNLDTIPYGFSPSENSVPFSDANVVLYPGVLNYLASYRTKWNSFSVERGVPVTYNPRSPMVSTRNLNLNKKYVEKERINVLPVDVGNTHVNYRRAEVQNLRYRSLYSSSVKVTLKTVEFLRNIELLDRVALIVPKVPEGPDKKYSGNYFVERIATRISSVDLFVDLLLTREGTG